MQTDSQPPAAPPGSLPRMVSEFASVTWKKIPADVMDELARNKCWQHCRNADVKPPDEARWVACREVWLASVRREHARCRARHLANAEVSQP